MTAATEQGQETFELRYSAEWLADAVARRHVFRPCWRYMGIDGVLHVDFDLLTKSGIWTSYRIKASSLVRALRRHLGVERLA